MLFYVFMFQHFCLLVRYIELGDEDFKYKRWIYWAAHFQRHPPSFLHRFNTQQFSASSGGIYFMYYLATLSPALYFSVWLSSFCSLSMEREACNAITFMSIIMFLTHSASRLLPFHQLIRFFSRDFSERIAQNIFFPCWFIAC